MAARPGVIYQVMVVGYRVTMARHIVSVNDSGLGNMTFSEKTFPQKARY